jgi:hypothetical protein
VTYDEVKAQMDAGGWDVHHHAGDKSSMCLIKAFGPITLIAELCLRQREWECLLRYLPDQQMIVRLETCTFSFPNKNFDTFVRHMRHYAEACHAAI